MKTTFIENFKLGLSIKGFYLCKEKHLRYTKNNDLYLDIILFDSSGIIRGKMWNNIELYNPKFAKGDPVAVKGIIDEYDNQLQLIISHINIASDERYSQYGYDITKIIPSISEPLEELWERLFQITNNLNNPLKKLVNNILKKYKLKIQTLPLVTDNQYPVYGSYLKHLVNVSEITRSILPLYNHLDHDLTLSGIILYQIGKVTTYNDDPIPKYTDKGKSVGEKILSRDLVIKEAKYINKISDETMSKLEEIILSNNKKIKYSNINSQSLESDFVNYISMFDIQINRFITTSSNTK